MGFAELAFEELAGRVGWERVDELDGLRLLERRQSVTAPHDDLVFVGVCTGATHDDCVDCFTPSIMGNADHCDLGDVRILRDDLLDLE